MTNTDASISAFWLKIIAIVGMALQHTALALRGMFPLPVEIYLQLSGGLTFPILAFLLVEGFRSTSNLDRYKKRILMFGLISIFPHMMAFGSGLNIMFTLLIGLVVLELRREHGNSSKFWILFSVFTLLSMFFDWGIIGIIVILLYDIIENDKLRRILVPVVACIGLFISSMFITTTMTLFLGDEFLYAMKEYQTIAAVFFPLGCLLTIPLLLMYKGERGRHMKWFFYTFYPVHLAILGVLSLIFGTNVIVNTIREVMDLFMTYF